MVAANLRLQTAFLRLRQQYWIDKGKELAGLDRTLVGFVEMRDFEGRHVYDDRRRPNSDRIHYIQIDARLMFDWKEWEAILLHEMAHLAVSESLKKGEGSHGKKWKAEVARLRALGAEVAD